MSTYTATYSREDNSMFVRSDTGSQEYPATPGCAEYTKVVRMDGKTIQPYVAPVVSDEERRATMQPLTARQFRLGLLSANITLTQVDTAIAAIVDDTERQVAQVEWMYATTFNRLHPLVVSLSATFGLTPGDVDTLWAAAVQL